VAILAGDPEGLFTEGASACTSRKPLHAPLKGRNVMLADASMIGSVLEYRKMVQLRQSRVRSCLLRVHHTCTHTKDTLMPTSCSCP
jgi:hypothetical protein